MAVSHWTIAVNIKGQFNMPSIYDKLNGGSRVRLARYRRKLEKSLETIRAHRTPEEAEKFIQAGRYTSPLNHRRAWLGEEHGPTFSRDGTRAFMPASMLDGFRDVGAAHDIVWLRYTGWHKDADGSETISGHVWQLPARNGETIYLAGYVEEDSGYCTLSATHGRIETYADKEYAASAADALAEKDAEKEREYSERWQAARAADDDRNDARQQLKAARADARQAIAAIRAQRALSGIAPAMCKILQDTIVTARDEMRRALETIADKTAEIEKLEMQGEF